MNLYLSSFRIGDNPNELVTLFGKGKRVAIIANATDLNTPEERATKVTYEHNVLRELGFVTEELDLREYFNNNTKLQDTISGFDCVWVRGGNVFLLRRAFRQSGFDNIIKEMIVSEDIRYGGYSAGVCILSPTLKGLELVDEPLATKGNYESDVIWDGLGILPYSIAPHYQSDHPESEAIDECVSYFQTNNMPYKTLRDGEAITIK